MRKKILETPGRIRLKLASLGVLGLAVAAVGVAVMGPASAATSSFSQGFESNTSGWFDFGNGTITRVPSGYTNGGGYANGINSSEGNFHARLRHDGSAGCTPPGVPSDTCYGPYTEWGGDGGSTFPSGGFVTQLDVYLDTAWAATNPPDQRFDFTTALNDSSGGFLRDFVFNAGTTPTGFVINASTNATRSGAFPANPCPSPSDPPNACRTPVNITQPGWYTFRHTFRDDAGTLAVDMDILNSSGAVVAHWTIYSGPIANAGAWTYGWFATQEIQDLAIDRTLRRNRTPQDKDECKKDGWKQFDNPKFKNQGDCVSYVQTQGRNPGNG
jgi:hypothetical protein